MIPVYNMLVSLWREVSDCEELVWDEIQLPVQSVIRIFLTKKQSRLESLFPGDCMAECRQKCRQMGSRASQVLQLQGLREQGIWFESPFSHHATPIIARVCESDPQFVLKFERKFERKLSIQLLGYGCTSLKSFFSRKVRITL